MDLNTTAIQDLTSSNISLSVCPKVCDQCPFSRNSAPGWLGDHTVDEIHISMSMEALFSCHKQRGDDPLQNQIDVETGRQQVCRGYIESASKSVKLFGGNHSTGRELYRIQQEVQQAGLSEDVMSIMEFREHHNLCSA